MIWVDAHISPALAKWISADLGHPAQSVRDLGLRNAKDKDIIMLRDAARPAEFILGTFGINDRVDVLDAAQFLTANIYERSLFNAADCRVTLTALLDRYNAIVAECETDPSLSVKMPR